ncbi:MAG: TetR/AcrR family transcriptional regulator [Gemmatimonadota bacterium]|nr:TetR/AcrR family transcriptional regulator [Gemmatimonadota bacterium]
MDIREKLLSAAACIYAEAGYRGATTRRIAQEAGVNEITLFRHFGSKDALLLEALHHCGRVPDLPPLPDIPENPARELTAWCVEHHATLYEKRSLIRTCMGEMAERPEMGKPATAGPCAAAAILRGYFVRLRERGIATGDFDPDTAAWMLLATIFADAMWRDVMVSEHAAWGPADESMAECVRMILTAIGAPSGPRHGLADPIAPKPRGARARSTITRAAP